MDVQSEAEAAGRRVAGVRRGFRGRLPDEVLDDALEYVDFNEPPLAVEILADQLGEYDVRLTREEWERLPPAPRVLGRRSDEQASVCGSRPHTRIERTASVNPCWSFLDARSGRDHRRLRQCSGMHPDYGLHDQRNDSGTVASCSSQLQVVGRMLASSQGAPRPNHWARQHRAPSGVESP